MALVVATGLNGVARAQAPWPAGPPPTWPPDLVQAPTLAPATDQQACVAIYAALRSNVERAGLAARRGADKGLPGEEMCKLVTAYSVAEISWMTYAERNMKPDSSKLLSTKRTTRRSAAGSSQESGSPAGSEAVAPAGESTARSTWHHPALTTSVVYQW